MGGVNGRNSFSVSGNGAMIYQSSADVALLNSRLAWYGRNGTPAGTALQAGAIGQIELSPDDERVDFRATDQRLADLLIDGQVMCHPFVVGELACGTLRRRSQILALLRNLPASPVVEHDEVLGFVDAHALTGVGLGWVDLPLLASVRLAAGRLWTGDRRLARAASRLGVAV